MGNFLDYLNNFSYVASPVRVIGCDYRNCASEHAILQNAQLYEPIEPKFDKTWSTKLGSLSFGLEYLIAALLSRGAIVKDQLLVCTNRIYS